MNMKKLVALLLALAMIFSLAACGGNDAPAADAPAADAPAADAPAADSGETVLRVSGIPGSVAESLLMLGAAFEEKNPGVKVEVVEFDEATYISQGTRILTAEENALDVAWYYRTSNWDTFVENGVYEPLNDIYAQEDMEKGFGQAVVNLFNEDGNYYAIPFTCVWIGNMFYNTKLIEEHGWEVPTTWDELYALAAEIKAEGLIPMAVAAKDSYGEHQSIMVAVRTFDPEAYATISQPGQNEIKYTDEAWMQTWEELIKLQENVFQEGAAAADSNVARSLFLQGQAVMYVDGSWADKSIKDEAPEGFEYSYAMIPGNTADAKVPLFLGNMMSVLSASKNKELAKQFVAFCGSVEAQEMLARAGGSAPARSDISADAKASMGEIYGLMYEDMENYGADLMFTMLLDSEFITVLCQVTQGVMSGSMTPEQACAQMQETYDSIYN